MQKLTNLLMNPILVKEFRGRMRSWKSILILVLYLLIIAGMTLAFIYMQGGNSRYMNPGRSREIFMVLCVLQLGLIGLVTPGLTAGVVSGERERQTLNILLTTQLSPTKIILSKLTSALAFIGLLVTTTLPLYALILLYGGVGPGQMLAVFGYYLIAVLLFGSIGIFCSSWFKRTGVSTVIAYGITVFILGGTGAAALMLQEWLRYVNRMVTTPVEFTEFFYVAGLNPVAQMLSMFSPDILLPVMNTAHVGAEGFPLPAWLYYLLVYVPLIALLLFLSVRLLSPVKRPLFTRKARKIQETQEVSSK